MVSSTLYDLVVFEFIMRSILVGSSLVDRVPILLTLKNNVFGSAFREADRVSVDKKQNDYRNISLCHAKGHQRTHQLDRKL
jgi:hypothetical protein